MERGRVLRGRRHLVPEEQRDALLRLLEPHADGRRVDLVNQRREGADVLDPGRLDRRGRLLELDRTRRVWEDPAERRDRKGRVGVGSSRHHEPWVVLAGPEVVAVRAEGDALAVALDAVMIHRQGTQRGPEVPERALHGLEALLRQPVSLFLVRRPDDVDSVHGCSFLLLLELFFTNTAVLVKNCFVNCQPHTRPAFQRNTYL